MGATVIAFSQAPYGDKYQQMPEYLSSEDGYWLKEDKWYTGASSFRKVGIKVPEGLAKTEYTAYKSLYHSAVNFITDYYGETKSELPGDTRLLP